MLKGSACSAGIIVALAALSACSLSQPLDLWTTRTILAFICLETYPSVTQIASVLTHCSPSTGYAFKMLASKNWERDKTLEACFQHKK